MAKKLSTAEILKAARAQSVQGGGEAVQPAAEASPPTAPAETPPAEAHAESPAESAPPTPAAKPSAPKSTKDILAAARAQSGGGAASAGAPAEKAASEKSAAAKPGAAKPAAGGAKSTKDILAAARAQSGGGAPAPAASSAAAKPGATKAAVAKAPAAAKPAGDRPSVQEMLKAAREGKNVATAAGEVTAAAKPAGPALVIPQKPAPAAKPVAVVDEPRRGFLAKLGVGLGAIVWALFGTPFRAAWTTFTGAMGVQSLAMARFMMPNVLVEPPSKFKVGPSSDYPPSAVSTKWTAQYGVWIVHNEYKGKDLIYALQTVCTHLGCTPNWLEGERKFKCPCHGSGFYITGINFEGPAPRPLERMAIRVSEDGSIEVDKSRKFQEELGQWQDPASYVEVA